MKYILLGILLALSPFTVKAEELKFPALTGRVVDTANEIPADWEAVLEKELADFEKQSKHQLVVVTIPDLKGNNVDEYTNKLARHWGIGRASVDDGIILLQSPGDGKPGSGKIRIEVGYGMEYVLTDVQTGRIIRSVMIPLLKQDKPREESTPEAIVAGAREIMRLGTITPEQIADEARLKREATAKRTAAVKDFFLTLGMIVLGAVVTAALGTTGWYLATRKKRAAQKAELLRKAQEKKRLQEEQRERNRLEDEERARHLQKAQERRQKAHAKMLADMTPAQRANYEAEQAQRRLAELEAVERRRKLEREREERENNLRIQQRDQRRRDEEEERNRSSYSYYDSGSSYSSNNSSSDSSSSSSSDWSGGGGGDFGGGGSSDSY